MRVTMTAWTECDAIPNAIAIPNAKDVMNVEKALIARDRPARRAFTLSIRALDDVSPDTRIALHFGSRHGPLNCTITSIARRIGCVEVVPRVVDGRAQFHIPHPDEILHAGPLPEHIGHEMGVFVSAVH
ncbi:hypothetical protein WJ24_05685 [Burkholderia vietnamiensis]|nr:hypothetical protein WK23_15715 [Burkholderia vietnamiensis]KVF05846.1 hypothetical protein WJ05_26230 [Burkholderia vietnamiensis]KVG12493.1 hypothetical protein WJ24_05685 [Burkholderia vietnamiensis]KVM56690.1 hypothetical protein WJ57_07435 [Burkholderia vietnamiensis]KVR97137.1 hypothetical protein WK30_25970 [Burkholderia vietnamiensis]